MKLWFLLAFWSDLNSTRIMLLGMHTKVPIVSKISTGSAVSLKALGPAEIFKP